MVGPRQAAVLCGPRCFQAFFEEVDEEEGLKQVRDGEGAYKQVVRYHHVGAGRGDFEPVTPQPATQTQLMWVPLGILLLFFVLSVPLLFLWDAYHHKGEDPLTLPDCSFDHPRGSRGDAYCCHHYGRCQGGTAFEDPYGYGGDGEHFDCDAGYEDWQSGWSPAKTQWCCRKEGRGCMQFQCEGEAQQWSPEESDWCCANRQQCQSSDSGACDTMCTTSSGGKSITSSCMDRIRWAERHFYSGQEDSCSLAYSRVRVDCDVCRTCSIEEAGCAQQPQVPRLLDDCEGTAVDRAGWSAEKKEFCCRQWGTCEQSDAEDGPSRDLPDGPTGSRTPLAQLA
ncbi:unnamed protein product [Durusdinium trenchii]|uniref:Cellulase n=2 Tax=Durusdinium trenchii TaxID=1381693 RepID=A0ABP0K1Y7_9DINO